VRLDGRAYTIKLEWIGRIDRWSISMPGIFGVRLLTTGSELLRAHRFNPLCPPGALFLYDRKGEDREATFLSLGAEDGHSLIDVTADTVAPVVGQ
jgi:hypothetical protein